MESLKQYLKQKSLIKFAAGFAAIVIVVWGGYLLWTNLRYDPIKAYEKAEKAYIEAMTADTYGGKTPQETLDLFVAALRAGDVELASKYFLLDESLSRERWVLYLTDIKNRGLLNKMAEDIKQEAKPFGDSEETRFSYALFNNNDVVEVLIALHFNEFSKIWKIESL